MKKLLLVFALLLTLVGCGESGAKKVVAKELDTIHDTALQQILDSIDLESLPSAQRAYIKEVYELLNEFDYEFVDVTEKDNAATVNVKIKCFNAADIFEDLENDADIKEIVDSLTVEYTEAKEQELMSRYAVKINKILSAYPKDYEETIEVPCVKSNNEWAIDASYDLKGAVDGVILGSLTELYK